MSQNQTITERKVNNHGLSSPRANNFSEFVLSQLALDFVMFVRRILVLLAPIVAETPETDVRRARSCSRERVRMMRLLESHIA